MKRITQIAIFDDEIFIYRGHKLRKYFTNWMRSARMRRAISTVKHTQLSRLWVENYTIKGHDR